MSITRALHSYNDTMDINKSLTRYICDKIHTKEYFLNKQLLERVLVIDGFSLLPSKYVCVCVVPLLL